MSDAIVHPPEVREFRSGSGTLLLRVSTSDHWKSGDATAEMLVLGGHGERTVRWRRVLPHVDGPRRVLVANSGVVILLDDWINSPSPRAIMVLNAKGMPTVTYTFEQVVSRLAVPLREVSAHATHGIWLAAEPTFLQGEAAVTLAAAGRTLRLTLPDGRLVREP